MGESFLNSQWREHFSRIFVLMKRLTLLLLAFALYSCSSSTSPSNSTQSSTLPGYRGLPYSGTWNDGWLGELDTLRFTSGTSVQRSYGGNNGHGFAETLTVTLANDSLCAIEGGGDSTWIVLSDSSKSLWVLHPTDTSLQASSNGLLRDAFKR